MSRLSDSNVAVAKEIIARYPRQKSALIPLLHLAQEQTGYISREAMVHLGELVGVTSAEVYGTATFYEMFRFEPIGKYLVNICGTMSCALMGSEKLMHHAEKRLGVKAGVQLLTVCSRSPMLNVKQHVQKRHACKSIIVIACELRMQILTI